MCSVLGGGSFFQNSTNQTKRNVFKMFYILVTLTVGLVFWLRYSDLFVSQRPRGFYRSPFPKQLICAFIIFQHSEILISCTIPSGSSIIIIIIIVVVVVVFGGAAAACV